MSTLNRGILLFLFLAGAIVPRAFAADTIVITSPGAGTPTLSGTVNPVTVSYTGVDIVKVCYAHDGVYPLYSPGFDAATSLGCALATPYTYTQYNTTWYGNGPHTLVATACSALGTDLACRGSGTAVATSAPVSFIIGNAWPNVNVQSVSLSPSTAFTSTWTAPVTVTPTLSGTNSGTDTYSCNNNNNNGGGYFIDGILLNTPNNTASACRAAMIVYPQNFQNGQHVFAAAMVDNTNPGGGTVYGANAGFVTGVLEPQVQLVTFNSGAIPSTVRTNASVVYLSPAATYNWGGAQILNTDGSLSAGSSAAVYSSNNTAIATINASTGVITYASFGDTTVEALVPTVHITDLVSASTPGQIQSSAHPFNAGNSTNWACNITSGPGWTPGFYLLAGYNGVFAFVSPIPGASLASGVADCGPVRAAQIQAWPTVTGPACFGPDGTIYSSYNSACQIMHILSGTGLGQGVGLIYNDQPYANTNADFTHLNTFESGCLPSVGGQSYFNGNETSGSTGYNQWHTALTSLVTQLESYVAGVPHAKLFCSSTGFWNGSANMWGATNGPAATTWTVPAWQDYLATLGWAGNFPALTTGEGADEWHASYTYALLAGPITYGITSQSWLDHITCTGGTCVATIALMPSYNNYVRYLINESPQKFVVHGSAVSGMNTVCPAVYSVSASTSTSFTFTAAGVADGTYGNGGTADPGFVLEPWADSCVPSTSPVNYLPYDVIAKFRLQEQAISGVHPGVTGWPLGAAVTWLPGGGAFAAWSGNTTAYTQSIGSVTQAGDYGGLWPAADQAMYLMHRQSAQALRSILWGPGLLYYAYGSAYDPSKPLLIGSNTTAGNYYGPRTLYPRPVVTGCSGNTITFSAPLVGLDSILPGMSRLIVSGVTDNGSPQTSCNGNFYIESKPTLNSTTVTMATPDVTTGGFYTGGGTITFSPSGTTLGLAGSATFSVGVSVVNSGIPTTGLGGQIAGTAFDYCAPPASCAVTPLTQSSTIGRLRGQVMNFSGTTGGGTVLNTRSWLFASENPAQQPAGQFQTRFTMREIPSFNCCAVSGSAIVYPDSNWQHGGLAGGVASTSGVMRDEDPGFQFDQRAVLMLHGVNGTQMYQSAVYQSGTTALGGYTLSTAVNNFSGVTVNINAQPYLNCHFQNLATVEYCKGANTLATVWDAYKAFFLSAHQNAPDYGLPFDCGSGNGAIGQFMGCVNLTDGTQTQTFTLTPYETSGQNVVRIIANYYQIQISVISAGTATDTAVVPDKGVVVYLAPSVFAGFLSQPHVALRLADVPNATHIGALCAYDPYYLAVAGVTQDLGAGTGGVVTATLPFDLNVGALYCKFPYMNAANTVLAPGYVQTF